MATVTQSIGTTSRTHSTITLWAADLDDDPTYDAGDDAIGECYDDSAFDEDENINGGATIGLNSIKLSVASGERHDGTAGTGARLTRSAFSLTNIIEYGGMNVSTVTVEWLDFSRSGGNHVRFIHANGSVAAQTRTTQRCLAHDAVNTASSGAEGISNQDNSLLYNILNNIVYDIEHNANQATTTKGIHFNASAQNCTCYNNTVHNIGQLNGSATGDVWGIGFDDDAQESVKNNIVTDTATAGSGTAQDYEHSAPTNATVDHNLASDTSASGTGSLDSKAATDQFVSTTGGSEDLHLKSGADAIDVGVDLGTTPSGVEIDIDDRDRDAEGDTWDMGADEFVAATAIGINLVMAPYTPA